jgi:hypothetical protein
MKGEIKNKLRHKAHMIEPLLSIEGEFTINDVKEAGTHSHMTPSNWLYWLSNVGAIEEQDYYFDKQADCCIHSWKWNQEKKQYLKDVIEKESVLPCGCRAHVPSDLSSTAESGTCKHCGEEWSKETFKQAL